MYIIFKFIFLIFFFRTALAEAELEYRDDHQSKSVYVKLPVIDSSKWTLGIKKFYNFIIN